MTGGIISRFRTMPVARVSMLAGHVGGAVIQTVLAMAAVTAVAVLTGFRSTTGVTDWLAAAAILVLFTFALTWLSVALGLAAKTVESASNAPTPLIILAFLGSGFVLTSSMPTAIRWFAEYQPFTPVIDTVRGLLIGGPIGNNAIYAIAWSLAITIGSYLWARKLFSRDPVRG
jgi:ABC-2 type transport system permease protein